ncbi:hypothetical protein Tsubulata_037147 [Turnera subulata]|uniref:Prolamin-like domain-containing protein n=1 Tax=Turnera subulata TaxID=218843 RepID=A0A9Q0JC93_9ROSI|nr:hypothetical protein Tsubulata_037147 [Turnera subulata]
MVIPVPAIPEKIQKTIEECSSKISVNNGNLLKESFLGKGNPTGEVCRVLVDFGKTCHEAFTTLMISKSLAAMESKIWAKSKSIWEHCSHDVPEKVQKTIEECSSKISVNNGNLLKESFLGKGDPTNEVCLVLVDFGKTCHEAFTKLMISKRPAAEESKIWARSKSIWEHCSHDVSDNSPASSLMQTLLKCGPKIEAKYGEQIRSNLLGRAKRRARGQRCEREDATGMVVRGDEAWQLRGAGARRSEGELVMVAARGRGEGKGKGGSCGVVVL